MKKTLICLVLGLLATGCWAKDPACSVIKTAADVCVMLEYEDVDGNTQRVKLAREDVDRLAREKAAKEKLPPPKAEPAKKEQP